MEYISKIAYLTADRISDLNNITSDFILEGWDMLDLVKEVQPFSRSGLKNSIS